MSIFKKKHRDQYEIVLSNDKPMFQPSRLQIQQNCFTGSTVERRVFKVDVGDIPSNEINGYMRGLVDGFKLRNSKQES